MTATTFALGKNYVEPVDESPPSSIWQMLLKLGKDLLSYADGIDDIFPLGEETTETGYNVAGVGKFRYLEDYNGRKVYAGSNDMIARLLNRYGDPGHAGGEINYGAAFDGNIFVNEDVVDGAFEGRVDPLSGMRLEIVYTNILAHELAHIRGADEKKANDIAASVSGIRF